MKKYIIILILVIEVNASIFAQIVNRTANLKTHIDSLINTINNVGGDNLYVEPTNVERASWNLMIDSIVVNNMNGAATLANTLDYRLILFTDNSQAPDVPYYVLEKKVAGSKYWGTYVFSTVANTSRPNVVIESPHEKFDFNTGKQGFYIFKKMKAYAFFLNGTHRCDVSTETTCDGTSFVCATTNSKFTTSDQAHNTAATFYLTSERIFANNPNLIVVQMHGFTKISGDPDLIISNGTDFTPSGIDYAVNFKTALSAINDTLNYKIGHLDVLGIGETWNRLLAKTNVVGRLINGGSADNCSDNSTITNGNFLHIEQTKEGLRNTAGEWDTVANALINTFPIAPLPIKLLNFSAIKSEATVQLNWITSYEHNSNYIEIQRSSSGTDFSVITKVGAQGNSTINTYYKYSDLAPNDGLNYYQLRFVDLDGETQYSNVVKLRFDVASKIKIYPNPVQNILNINLSDWENKIFTLKLYNQLGQEILNKQIINTQQNQILDFSNLTSGVYMLKLQDINSNVKTVKINVVK